MVSTEKKTVATALETSSWAVAAAHGFEYWQLMPRDFMLAITQRIAACVTVPVTADFEGGHAVSPPRILRGLLQLCWRRVLPG